jgi:gluconolactonase
VILDRFNGKRLNSPMVKSDGTVWFTDPPFGIIGNYEGYPAAEELPQNVYRVDPATGHASVAAEGLRVPNELAFSPDERCAQRFGESSIDDVSILRPSVSRFRSSAFFTERTFVQTLAFAAGHAIWSRS